VARRRASALFDLCAGFVYSQVLHACVRLRLLETLRGGALPAATVATRIDLPLDATERLLDAAAALGLVERRPGDRWGLGIHGASYVGNPAVAAMVQHHVLLYQDLADPVALLRRPRGDGALGRFWRYGDDEAGAPYSELMARSLALLAEDVLEAHPVARHRALLDVGGGSGAFVAAVARRAPDLGITLFDLPAVAAQARRRLGAAEATANVRVVAGDVFRDPLPRGADLVTLVRVLHDHDDADARRILGAVRDALPTGGTLLVAEPMRDAPDLERMGAAYFGLYLWAMGQGRARTPRELRAMLTDAGFRRVRVPRTRRPLLTSVVVAEAG
jgi:demethylspheroidene O-methyltransferase